MDTAEMVNVLQAADLKTRDSLKALREVVEATRGDLRASHDEGKWAVRYPNGRRVAEELDVRFQVMAQKLVLRLLDRIEGLDAEFAALAKSLEEAKKEAPKEPEASKDAKGLPETKEPLPENSPANELPVDEKPADSGMKNETLKEPKDASDTNV
jgi:recombinational DNA repair protein RecT